jgi:DNA-binding SARP family transcriptional activator/tetratricopeptide (TPR) repeat protein
LSGAARADGETRIRLCGELVGTVRGRPLEQALRGRLGRLLFAYLVLNRERSVTRDELIDRLWDESPPSTAATTLSSLLSRMRSGLGADVLQGRTTLRLVLAPDAWIDVEAARTSVGEARAALEKERPADSFTHAREALGVLDQTLLVGVESSWLDDERRNLEELATQALECVAGAGARLRDSEAAEGERAARAVVERAPYRETGYRRLMEALESRGNVAEALRVYEQCRALLGEELGAAPGPELRALHQRLLSEAEQPRPADEARGAPLAPALQPRGDYVGREAERERLERLWTAARGGRRGIALIAGEPGIGKTRLCGQVATRAASDGGTVLYGRCEEELVLPYQPWVAALEEAVAVAPEDELRAYVTDHGGDLARLAPGLSRRLPEAAAPHESDPETERYMLFGAVVRFLSRVSRKRPALLVLDDLHAADTGTLLLLRHLAGAGAAMRLLVLAAYRSSEVRRGGPVQSTLADLHRHGDVERLELTGLGEAEVARLMQTAAGHELDAAALALAGEIWRETDGNPFFVIELLHHLHESGAVDGRFEVTGSLAGVGLPRSVREVIALRVQHLHEGALDVLTTGAMIGREFDLDLVAPVSGLPEGDVLDLLDSAVDAALLTEVPERPGRFSFVHALIGHTLYENLGPARRARLHGRVGEALEQLAGEDPGPLLGELARHWSAAGPADALKALDYNRRAAAHALENLAPDEAIRRSAEALSIFRDRGEANDALRCDLLVELGEAQRQARDAGYRETLLAAAAAARRLQDPDRLFRAAVASARQAYGSFGGVDDERAELYEAALAALAKSDSRRRAHLLALLAAERTWHPDAATRRRLAHQAIELAHTAGDPRTLAVVLQLTNLPLWEPDTVELRRRHAAEGIKISAELGGPRLGWWANFQEQVVAFEADDLPASERALREMRRLADETGHPSLEWMTSQTEATVLTLHGRYEEAEAIAKRAAESGERDALTVYIPQIGLVPQIALIRFQQGRAHELTEQFRQASHSTRIPAYMSALALALIAGGRLDEAQSVVGRMVAGELTILPWFLTGPSLAQLTLACADLDARDVAPLVYTHVAPWAHLLVFTNVVSYGSMSLYAGALARLCGGYEESERHLLRAAEVNERIQAPFFVARTHLEIARLYRDRQQADDRARQAHHVALALALARDHGLTQVESQALTLPAAAAAG